MRTKKLYGHYKWLISNITHENPVKGNFKIETETLLMSGENNAISTNRIKPRIDKTQQNNRCRLCVERNETTNHIISECRKLA